MVEHTCNGCNAKISNIRGSVIFKCPKCGKKDIVRCTSCRKRGTRYKCSCGFEGPN